MTMEPSQEYVKRQLQLADEALSDANYLLKDHRLKAAANRAYYAMFYAARAALDMAKIRKPRTHSGTLRLFNEHYIKAQKIDTQFSKVLQDAFDLRQKSDYETYVTIGEEQVREIVQKSEAFVIELRRLLGLK